MYPGGLSGGSGVLAGGPGVTSVVLVVCLVALIMSGACGFIWPNCA